MSNLVVAQSHSIGDVQTMAKAVAQSNLFGIKTPEQAMALMLLCQAEGMHPMIAARDYHIIEGRPSLKSDAMLARFQLSGGKVRWTTMTDDKVAAVFSHPQGGEVEIDWTMARAKQAQLGGKGNWQKYPRQMLRARVISEGIRATYPACVVGVYTPEEVQDFETPAAPASQPQAIKPAPIAFVEATVVDERADDDELVGFREAISACTTEQALKVVGEQIRKRGIKGAPAKELKDLYRAQQAAIAQMAQDVAAVPVPDESQPAMVAEVE